MNKQELNNIIDLLRDLEDIEGLLLAAHNNNSISIQRIVNSEYDNLLINSELMIPILIAHQNKIKSELTKLGYEE